MSSDVHEHREWLVSLLPLADARSIVDVGCGAGEDLALMARRARSDATLYGLDSSERQLAKARAIASGDARMRLLRHDVATSGLPFADASVDVLYSNNLLECLPEPATLLQEIRRVLRPTGQVLCAHWDWDTQTIDADDKALVRRVIHAFADWQQPWMEHADGWMGRRLRATFQHTGLFDGSVRTRVLTNTRFEAPWYGHARIEDCRSLVTQGLLSAADYERFLADMRARAQADAYFYSITGYAYLGRPRQAALPNDALHRTGAAKESISARR